MDFVKKHITSITILFIGIVLLFSSANINWGKEHWKYIIKADGKGYYAWLPAIFIYKDLNFAFFDKIENEEYFKEEIYYDYRVTINNKTSNKYFVGTAILQLPFFLTAHFLTYITSNNCDGYSKWYAIFVNIAAILYALAGLVFSDKLLVYFSIKPINRILVLLLFVFATNMFYYVVCEPAMSHVYSFFCITAFCYYASQLKNKINVYLNLSILLALIVLIRPANGIIMFIIPLFFSSIKDFLITISASIKKIILPAFVFIAILCIQPILYFLQTEIFFPDTYPGEHFNFLNPKIFLFLFSFKKGIFIYTPLLLLSLTGFYFYYRISKYQAVYLFVFLLSLVFILSSWWNWWYGGSFSSRVILDFLILFILLFGIALEKTKGTIRKVYLFVSFLFLLFCQIQTYQYRYYIIHWENMNKELYIESICRIKNIL